MNNAVSEQSLNRNPAASFKKCESCTSSFNFIRKKVNIYKNQIPYSPFTEPVPYRI